MVLNTNNNDIYSAYYKQKLIEFFINSPSIQTAKQDLTDLDIFEFLYHDSFLESIKSYINQKKCHPYFTFNQKQRMYALLSEFQKNSNLKHSHTRKETINSCITSLNNMSDVLSEDKLINLQFKMRFPFYIRKKITLVQDALYSWSATDLDFLYQLGENISEDLFQENLPDFIATDAPLSSIFTYAKECPIIFQDETALRRTKMLLSCNFALREGKEVLCPYQKEDVAMAKNNTFYLLNTHADYIVTRCLKKR